MADWLTNALAYIPLWVGYQQRQNDLPGVSVAIGKGDKVLAAFAFGMADLASETKMLPTHRFRVASHSKTFTATAIMLLVEAGRIKLDDRVGDYVPRLHKDVAAATIRQLLSHSAGIIRDGLDTGQWAQRRPFLNEAELRAELAQPPVIPANTRMKYSNHGFGLLGLLIEAMTGEAYDIWMQREVIAKVKLRYTFPDAPATGMAPLSAGHSSKILLGKRAVIPTDTPTNALAAATGFISTAADLVRFFSQLDPAAPDSILSVESRREMTRRQWPVPDQAAGRHYGLGTIQGDIGDWSWFGHSGGFPGMTTHTAVIPSQGLTISVLTNATDGAPATYFDGITRILQACAKHGPPVQRVLPWTGRWWNTHGAVDLLALGETVFVAAPGQADPLADVPELEVVGPDSARVRRAGGFASHGETARLLRARGGALNGLYLAGSKLLLERDAIKEAEARYFPE